MIVERVFVLSLAHRQDRRGRLAEAWRYRYPSVPLTFVEATADPGDPAAGCLASHLRLLSALTRPTLILEDDAVLGPSFTLDLHPPADWRVLWLGRQRLAPEIVVDDVWARPWRIARTHAYVARDPQDLHARLVAAAPASIDPALSRLDVAQYMLRTATVGQAAGRSDITGAVRGHDLFWND